MNKASETLPYTTPDTRAVLPPAGRSYWIRIAVACWIIPLLAGLVIFGWSEVIRPPRCSLDQFYGHGVVNNTPLGRQLQSLIGYGMFDLVIGAMLAFYGLISLVVFAMLRWGPAVDRWRQVVRPAALVLALILSNFVVAVVVLRIAMR